MLSAAAVDGFTGLSALGSYDGGGRAAPYQR
jgi:hypothetical protein